MENEPITRCLVLLRSIRSELDQAKQWPELRKEIDELIRSLEDTMKCPDINQRNTSKTKTLLASAMMIVRIILGLSED